MLNYLIGSVTIETSKVSEIDLIDVSYNSVPLKQYHFNTIKTKSLDKIFHIFL